MSDRDKKNLQANGSDASSYGSFVPSIIFYDAKCPFCLNGSIHSEQCSMDTFKIFYHFLMHSSKFVVDSYRSILISLFAFFRIWTSGTIFALVYFFLSSILISFHMLTILQMKRFSVWAAHDSIFSDREVDCAEWILMIFLICCFLLEHRKLHVFFHSVHLPLQSVRCKPEAADHFPCSLS